MIVIGQHGMAAGAEEVAVPDADEREHDRQVPLERRVLEMLVHGVAAA